ncbi:MULTISPECIES: 2'-5' RNA ligase family protein, partial [unclassified Streptomyces]|uniref:2'-5' RNA ligase family protein n=1 Tax=unclassified Streptomyces TaxID=2593676 RepID=UPI00081E9915
LWAGAAGDIDTLRRLAERADAAARRSGLPMEEHRHYRPHLTLAHSRTDQDLRPYATAMDGFEGTPWEVAELALVRSRLPVSGVPGEQPRYETLVRFPLGRARREKPNGETDGGTDGKPNGNPGADQDPGAGRETLGR